MTGKLELRDRRTLVTGASSGLGRELAVQLARDWGAHPVLVARREQRLAELATELRALGARPEVIVADLTRAADVDRVFAEATREPLHAAVLNAGVTYFGRALAQPLDSLDAIVATNVASVGRLTLKLAPYLVARGEQGALMVVSSMTGFMPMAYQAVYGASKAFVTSLARALQEELRAEPISITVFAPGGIATEMTETSGTGRKYGKGHPMVMDVEPCARIALAGFVRRKRLVVPGALNKLSLAGIKLGPTGLVSHLVGKDYEDALE